MVNINSLRLDINIKVRYLNYKRNKTTEILFQFSLQTNMIKTRVAVIGGGPVGLFSSLLLQHFKIDHVTFDRYQKPRSHPSAHWISGRSKQILSQIPNLAQKIDEAQQNFQNFRSYRYCETLFGFQFGFKDHFKPSIQQKISHTKQLFGQYPNHMSQAKLLQIMYQHILSKERVVFGSNIATVQPAGQSTFLYNSKRQKICQAEYVILANGFNSQIRDSLGIKMEGQNQYMNIVNIHFESKTLAKKILQKNHPAMLHFVYNKTLPSILVNHSYQTGTFVLQVPNYEPFVDLTKVYSPRQLLATMLQPNDWESVQKDINIIHVGKWKLQALLASKLRDQNIFLAGDTAHTYTPAGGFGMNSGFQDAHQIVHFLDFIKRNPNCNKQALFQTYNLQRRQVDYKYLEKSLENYDLTQQSAQKVIKYSKTLTNTFLTFSRVMPKAFSNLMYSSKDEFIQSLRLKMMSMFFARAKFQPKLQLFFDQFDRSVCNLSQRAIQIAQNTKNKKVKDLYVSKDVDMNQIKKLFGDIKEQNIEFFQPKGHKEKIIRRDGIFL